MDLEAVFESVRSSVATTAYVLSRERRIVEVNDGWFAFARANGGTEALARFGPGARLDEVIPEPLRAFYLSGFERAFAEQTRWEHDYECSSADTLRRFRMTVYPGRARFVVVHSLLVESPHPGVPVDPSRYVGRAVIVVCSHCRRVRAPDRPERWDWVPDLVTLPPPNLSHGLCGPCAEFYYPVDER